MSGYFFIVESGESDTDHVIENSSQYKHLVVSKFDGSDNQQWSWKDDGSLQNKGSGLVITGSRGPKIFLRYIGIKVSLVAAKNSQAQCQKWCIVKGQGRNGVMIRNRNGRYIAVKKGQSDFRKVYSVRARNTCNKKWLFIPNWDQYKKYLNKPHLETKALLLKENLLNHMECILGCTMEEYKKCLEQCRLLCVQCAKKISKFTKIAGKVKVAGGGFSIVGGILGFLGVALVPVSAGASLTLTVAGAATVSAGGMASFGAQVASFVNKKRQLKKIKSDIDKVIRLTTGLQSMIVDIDNNVKEDGCLEDLPHILGCERLVVSGGLQALSLNSFVGKGIDVSAAFKKLETIAALVQADVEALNGMSVAVVEGATANGLKLSGKVLIQAGTKLAKICCFSMLFLAIAFGIYDIYDGVNDTRNSEAAEKILELSATIDKAGKEVIEIFHELLNNNCT